ncbi:MAG: glycosyltransferase, partial [Cyanobium sp.]
MRLPWAVALLLLLGLRYLIWRVTDTLNLASPLAATISVLALLAEALLLGSGFLELLFSLWLPRPASRTSPTMQAAGTLPESPLRRPGQQASGQSTSTLPDVPLTPSALPGAEPPLAVDVLIPTYGEPAELIQACLKACLALDHPRFVVWLLDDSGREELRLLCRQLGVRYLSRDDRRHAKAGNLNHALPHLQGELIAVFDADVLPLRAFLQRTVPLFGDPAVGFVQTPQTYRNADPVMRNLALERWLMPDEESFYRWIEPCREAVGALVCAGTSFVMRREALLAVGGFETGTPSEDLATGIRITAAGYRNRYLPEKLSAGLAPFTAAAMARQRRGRQRVVRQGGGRLPGGLLPWAPQRGLRQGAG